MKEIGSKFTIFIKISFNHQVQLNLSPMELIMEDGRALSMVVRLLRPVQTPLVEENFDTQRFLALRDAKF